MDIAHFGQNHLALNITRYCNQRCIFCFEGERAGWGELSKDKIKQLIRSAIKKNIRSLIFMGAEALIRKDIIEIIKMCKSLGMTSISAFTNGLMLSKEKFIDELSSAGLTSLSVSFHYDNAVDYEKYTRRNKENFYKILRGLEMVKNFNNHNPDRRITISTETMLFSGNQDKLVNIIKIISSALENQVNYIGFKRIQRFNCKKELYLLDDLSQRKKELVDILKKYKYNYYFTRIPLCIIPNYEHLSTDLHYYLKSSKVIANFTDKNQIDPMHNLIKDLLDDPFNSFCIKCNLLGLCPMGSSSYENKAFFPYESQKPFPSKKDIKQIIKNIAQNKCDETEMFKNYLKVNVRLKEEYKKALSCP